eukprot:TRINITY_DN94908_c0_g1_i1.p1 TRINITY_DN94908_c0_g1~~TRINITY_DN94908_c0_g1_i1.p1  ORF type:complete len:222 (+),score=57.63 TRINITY_DN94908_c0_g1_i1:76-741(+)
MFTLVLIDDDIPVQPNDFRECHAQLKREIQKKYVDRVIPRVGLCVQFYDFVRVKEAIVHPGDGKLSCAEALFKVEFHVIVFQPEIGEWLVGTILESTRIGLRVSLGFFQDVLIPASNLQAPYVFDGASQTWAWQYRAQDTGEVINFFYERGEQIRFRVTAVEFPEAFGPKGPIKESAMQVVGAVNGDGLGVLAWWQAEAPGEAAAEAIVDGAVLVKEEEAV